MLDEATINFSVEPGSKLYCVVQNISYHQLHYE